MDSSRNRATLGKLKSIAVAVALLACAAPTLAVEIDTGNPDLKFHWDTTVRYTLANRAKSASPSLLSSPNYNDGDGNFRSGIVENRLDVLTEADLVYKDYYGVRVSAQGWKDWAYGGMNTLPPGGTYNHINAAGTQVPGLTNYAERYFDGPSGELLDAFVFARIPIEDHPIDIRLGRFTEYWGESLFPGGTLDGIAYGQAPLDIARGLTMPGVESKELYRPLGQISANWKVTSTFSLQAEYFSEWQPFHVPEGGTYLGNIDFYMSGIQQVLLYPVATPEGLLMLKIPHGQDTDPSNSGSYGLAGRWSPDFLDSGTLGFYYRRFSDMLPQVYLTVAPTPAGLAPNSYHFAYDGDIQLYGISLSKNIAGISWGAEVSFRHNMPLYSQPAVVYPNAPFNGVFGGALLTTSPNLPAGYTPGARGDTAHAVLNGLVVEGGNKLWDQITLAGELNYDRWVRVTSDPLDLFEGAPGFTGINRVTKNSAGVSLSVTPEWFQVVPGVDLSMPVSLVDGIWGNSAVALGSAKGTGTFSYGFSADVWQKYTVALQYVGFFGRNAYEDGALTPEGSYSLLKDRGFVALTFKTNF